MVVKEGSVPAEKPTADRSIWWWLSLVVSALLAGVGVWYIVSRIGIDPIREALAVANFAYIALSVLLTVLIVLIKVWRWRLLLLSEQRDLSLRPLFWATMLGHYVNLVVPFLRLGDIARVYALKRNTGISSMLGLGTIAVEKALNMVMLLLTLAALLPFIALPDYIVDPGISLGIVSLTLIGALYLLAYRTQVVVSALRRVTGLLPAAVGRRVMGIVVSGLEGVAGLRNQRTSVRLIAISAVLAFLAILPPYLLLLSFKIPFGFAEATLINVVATIALTPPSTPVKIGVFDGAVAFLLLALGMSDEALIASYTIVYHLIVILPLVLAGGIAASRYEWRWRSAADASQPPSDV